MSHHMTLSNMKAVYLTVYPNSSSDPLGVLAPILPQSEVFGSVQSQNMVLPQNEVYKYYLLSQNEMFGSVQSQNMVLPQNEVYKYYLLSQIEMFGSVQSQNMVFPQNKVYRIFVLPQSEMFGPVQFIHAILNKNQLNPRGLIHAMRSNGPLHQVCLY